MAAQYELNLLSPFGTKVAVLELGQVTKLSYVRTTNAVGALTIECARNAVPESWVTEDARVEIYRKPDGAAATLEGEGPWLLSAATKGVSKEAGRYWRFKADNLMTLLKRRHAFYYANGGNALYNLAAESFLKSVFDYNLGANGDASPFNSIAGVTARDWSAYMSVSASLGQGPTISKQFAWRNVLPVMQEVAKASYADSSTPTPIYFDIVQAAGALFEFRVYVGQRGVDRSTGAAQLVVSPERGSLGGTVESSIDWSDAASVVAAGGQGQDAARLVVAVVDAAAVARSPFGRREAWVDATQVTTLTALATEAVQELRSRRAKRTLTGDLVSVPGAVYGLDWGHGDKIIAELEHEQYTARVDATTVTLDGGKETIKAAIKGEL